MLDHGSCCLHCETSLSMFKDKLSFIYLRSRSVVGVTDDQMKCSITLKKIKHALEHCWKHLG